MGYNNLPCVTIEDTFINPRDKDVSKSWDELNLIVLRGDPMHPHLHEGAASPPEEYKGSNGGGGGGGGNGKTGAKTEAPSCIP